VVAPPVLPVPQLSQLSQLLPHGTRQVWPCPRPTTCCWYVCFSSVVFHPLFFIRCFSSNPVHIDSLQCTFFQIFQKISTVCPRFAGGVDGIDDGPVREIFIVHVGGTRRIISNITSSTDRNMNNMKIQARITLTVECIHVFCYFYLMCSYNDE
jgi:hypothetical protein